jgi:quercetin dioxygenase-like cupin family protein
LRNSDTPVFNGATEGDTGLSLAVDTLLSGASPGPRRHTYPILLIPQQGRLVVTIASQTYQVPVGQVLLVPPNTSYTVSGGADFVLRLLTVHGSGTVVYI